MAEEELQYEKKNIWLGLLESSINTGLDRGCRQGKRGAKFGMTKIWREDMGSRIKGDLK